MGSHAVLSPSSALRWLSCTPSARLEEKFPDQTGQAAREGTLAHDLGQLLIKLNTKQIKTPEFLKALDVIKKNPLYDNSMMDHSEAYAFFVIEKFSEAQAHTKDALLFLEQELNLADYVPESFGTVDSIIIADTVMDIVDLKYGKGVPVSAVENRQMMLYALGALREFDYIYDIRTIRMTIYQPRLDTISTWEIEVADLQHWADTELKEKAALAFEGKGVFVPGLHCQFCKVKATCRAHAEYHLETAKYDFKESVLLTDKEVADILSRSKLFKSWLTDVEEHALGEAVNNNKQWPGYKLVAGKSNRIYSNQADVAKTLLKAGFAEDLIFKKELLGITAMEKELGKGKFAELLDGLLIKPPGKPTLVPESDKRPEYNSADGARKDFETIQ